MVFIKAKVGPALIGHPKGEFTVHYFDEQGNLTIRSKGKRTWRCNNPGNLKVGGNLTPPEEYERAKQASFEHLLARERGKGRPSKKDRREIERLFGGGGV